MITVQEQITPGAHELLTACLRALEASDGNDPIVKGTLRVLLRPGTPPLDTDCRLLASVLTGTIQDGKA